MKALCLALLCVLCVEGAGAQQPKAPPASPKDATAFVDELYDAYINGDRLIIGIRLRTPEACARIQPALESTAKALTQVWKRENAAFILELANVVSACAPKEVWTLISDGRNYVIERPPQAGAKHNPASFGVDKNDDVFELIWHKIAVAILLREQATTAADVYLDTLERRYGTSPAAKAAHTTLDPRFLLMRGVVAEFRASLVPAAMLKTTTTAGVLSATDASHQAAIDLDNRVASPPQPEARTYAPFEPAVKALEQAVASDPTGVSAPEAYTRIAAVRLAAGKPADALVAIDRVNVPSGDSALAYWAALWRGRILDALNRQADAARAYQQALDVSPGGQAAGVGLALSLFKQNRRVEAAEAATRVQSFPPTSPDPWWLYRNGDARFIIPWIDELRRTLQ